MRQTITPLFIFFLVFGSCAAQEENYISYPSYHRSMNVVSSLIQYNQMESAIYLFDSISSRVPHIPSEDLMRVAVNCGLNDRCELAAKYFELALENGCEHGKEIGAFIILKKCKDVTDVLLDLEDEIHKRHFNYQYKMSIDSMSNKEWNLRQAEDYDLIPKLDSLHMIKLLDLIEQYGFPGEKIIGNISADNAYSIMLHMDQDRGNKILRPILEKAYNDGYLSPYRLASIVDRRRYMGTDKLEPYYNLFFKYKKYESFNSKELDELNRRRDSIGLFNTDIDH